MGDEGFDFEGDCVLPVVFGCFLGVDLLRFCSICFDFARFGLIFLRFCAI